MGNRASDNISHVSLIISSQTETAMVPWFIIFPRYNKTPTRCNLCSLVFHSFYGFSKYCWARFSDASNEAMNGMAWFRGEAGQQGFNSMNFQSMNMIPWMQQRFDPSGLRNDLSQQYQAMLAAGLQNFNGGELLKNQSMQFQQPLHYLQNLISPHTVPAQTQMLSDNMQRPLQPQVDNQTDKNQQDNTYHGAYFVQQGQPFDIPSSSFLKSEFTTSNDKFPAQSTMQNMGSSICPDGSSNLLNFSRIGEPVLNEQSSQQSWMVKFAESSGNGGSSSKTLQPYSGNDEQNPALFGANIDSSALLIPPTMSIGGTVHADISSVPQGQSGYQSPLYGCVQDSSDMLQRAGELDQPISTRTFVKVHLWKFILEN